jgi:hypothetical protein
MLGSNGYDVRESRLRCYSGTVMMLQSDGYGVTECLKVLQSVTECYRVLQSVSECYRVLQCVYPPPVSSAHTSSPVCITE